MKKALLSTDVLNKVWNDWLEKQQLTAHERSWVLGRPFGAGSRRMNKRQRFEDWLFNQGATIKRINKQFYIEFTDPKQASFFLLRWS